MPVRTVVTWNCMMSILGKHGCTGDALFLFRELMRNGVELTECTALGVLSVCGVPPHIALLPVVHGIMVRNGMERFNYVANSLLNAYCRCSLVAAEQFFGEMSGKDIVSWNTILMAYAGSGAFERSVKHFFVMLLHGYKPNETSFSCFISVCTLMNASDCGKLVHAKAIKGNLDKTTFVNAALVGFYAKCASRTDARRVLNEASVQSIVTWNALVPSYANEGLYESIVLLRELLGMGISPNEVTFSSLLKYVTFEDLSQIHSLVVRMGYQNNDYVSSAIMSGYHSHGIIPELTLRNVDLSSQNSTVHANVLASAYNRSGKYQDAQDLLLGIEFRDTVSWSILFTACARSNDFVKAFALFRHMRSTGYYFDKYMAVSLLNICSRINNLALGSSLHGLLLKTNAGCSDTFVDNLLLDMYAKSGSVNSCLEYFQEMDVTNLISWTTVISGLGLNGRADEAIGLFTTMKLKGLKPDRIAMLAVLTACKHGGLVNEGMSLFKNMKSEYEIEPDMDHYICVVDMLCKSGKIREADFVISCMPFQPNAILWRTFLQGCKKFD